MLEPISDLQVEYADPLTLPRLTLAQALAGANGVFCPQPKSRSFLRPGPHFVDNPDNVPGFDLGEVSITYPPPFLSSASDATIVGYRSVVTSNGLLFNDDSVEGRDLDSFLDRIGTNSDSLLNEDTSIRHADGKGKYYLSPSPLDVVELNGTTISLCSQEPSNYGSFIFRLLPKIYSLKRWGLTEFPVLMYPASENAIQCLELAGVDRANIIHHDPRLRYKCDHVLVPSMRNNQAYLDDQTVDLIGGLRERFGSMQVPGKRIYVSRHKYNAANASPREMCNEHEVIERLLSKGFEIISPEKLTMRQQIEAFSSAEMVVGPAGSGMFNSVFCWPGTKVIDIESERWWLHAHMSIFGSSHLHFGIFVGAVDPSDTSPAHKRWAVNIGALSDCIDRFNS
jgi:capsular polysaccharide biosynthesis protein